jgi:hypothetical protein
LKTLVQSCHDLNESWMLIFHVKLLNQIILPCSTIFFCTNTLLLILLGAILFQYMLRRGLVFTGDLTAFIGGGVGGAPPGGGGGGGAPPIGSGGGGGGNLILSFGDGGGGGGGGVGACGGIVFSSGGGCGWGSSITVTSGLITGCSITTSLLSDNRSMTRCTHAIISFDTLSLSRSSCD